MFSNRRSIRTRMFFISALFVFAPAFVFAVEDTASDVVGEQWAFQHTGVAKAHTMTQGSSDVVVAIIDNGFDTFHPELRKNAWQNIHEIPSNNIDDDENGYIDDVWGWDFVANDDSELGDNDPRPDATRAVGDAMDTIHHATLVAGLIGANGTAFTGIAPNVRLMNLRIVDEGGSGTLSTLPKAIRYAVDNGADIINMSIIGNESTGIREAVQYAYTQGVAVVAAAGNNAYNLNADPFYPVCADADADEQRVLGVSAMDESHRLSFFSNIGSSCIDITAPGSNITSTVRFSPTNNLPDHILDGWSGTSFAAPFVSGALALIKSIQPTWTVAELYTAVLSTTHHTPNEDEVTYANLFGKGLLQIDKAVQYAYDRMVSQRVASALTFIDTATGQAVDWSEVGVSPVRENAVLAHVDSVVSFVEGSTRMYVTSQKASASERSITVHTDAWTEQSSFRVASTVPLAVSVGDVTGDGQQNIVVAPTGQSTELFRVYSLSGELLHTYSQKTAHSGASVALSRAGEIAVYSLQHGGTLGIDVFDHDFTAPVRHLGVDMVHKRGSIAFGDVDGDRVDDIIVGGAPGEAPFVSVYTMDGSMKRTFSVYGGYQGGFSLASLDYDRDGKDDILAVPFSNKEPVRVWTGRVKKLAETRIFDSAVAPRVLPLILFQ